MHFLYFFFTWMLLLHQNSFQNKIQVLRLTELNKWQYLGMGWYVLCVE